MKSLKVVFDTNIYLSGLLFGGNPLRCLEMGWERRIKVISSKAILLELADKLYRKFNWSGNDIRMLIDGIGKFAEIVEPKQQLSVIKQDEADNRILEAAKESNANYIITGDKKHVLPIKKFGDTQILSAAEFIKLVDVEN